MSSIKYDAGIASAAGKPLETVGQLLQDYRQIDIRVLADGEIMAVVPMLFTWAVLLGVSKTGFDTRICYATQAEALACMAQMQHIDTPPLPGYKAIK
mgnify:CR=1 FL=1